MATLYQKLAHYDDPSFKRNPQDKIDLRRVLKGEGNGRNNKPFQGLVTTEPGIFGKYLYESPPESLWINRKELHQVMEELLQRVNMLYGLDNETSSNSQNASSSRVTWMHIRKVCRLLDPSVLPKMSKDVLADITRTILRESFNHLSALQSSLIYRALMAIDRKILDKTDNVITVKIETIHMTQPFDGPLTYAGAPQIWSKEKRME